MVTTLNAPLSPGFSLTVQQNSNPIILCNIYDRGGNLVDLTGKAVKLAAKRKVRASNGIGQLTVQDQVFFDVAGSLVTPARGIVSFALPPSILGTPGVYAASLRIWNFAPTLRNPDDAYSGTFIVEAAVVQEES